MEGVILFADDKVFEPGTPENRLYLRLSKDYPVLGVDTIELADKAISSIGTFSAIILDWEFREDLGGHNVTRHPNLILDGSNFYSLVYVFSNVQIAEGTREKYQEKFEKRIIFRNKYSTGSISQNVYNNFRKIRKDITEWQTKNQNQIIPQQWSNSINQSVQVIFSQLSKADPNWIRELHASAVGDVNPEIEVISLMQSLLFERLVTDQALVASIKTLVASQPANISNDGLSELFQKIYYTDLSNFDFNSAPVMTGDIIRINPRTKEYGIIITPECDIKKVVGNNRQTFQVLKFKRADFDEYIVKEFKGQQANVRLTAANRIKVSKLFNQPHEKLFFLPSFPFKKRDYNFSAMIDFSNSIKHLTYPQLIRKERICKLNMPFIQQLRQKYLSYIGRIGVPTVPNALKLINISHL